jgi:hypothetical protein
MKRFITTFMMLAMLAIMLPLAANAQTYTTRQVYRNGRLRTVRVSTKANPGRHYGSYKGKHYGWRNRNRVATITPQEQRRLMRQRNRITTLQNRVTRDGVVTNREARKVTKRTVKYQQKVMKAGKN